MGTQDNIMSEFNEFKDISTNIKIYFLFGTRVQQAEMLIAFIAGIPH